MDSEKIKVYNEVCSIMVESIFVSRQRQKQSTLEKIGKRLSNAGYQLFIVAPDDVVQAYLKWRAMASANENQQETMDSFSDLVLEMRKDLHPSTNLTIETANDLLF